MGSRRSIARKVLNVASVSLLGISAVLVVGRFALSLHRWDAIWVAAALPAGLAMADLISAIAHWFGDTFFAADTPLLGPVVGPFRLHHDDPDAFRRRDVWARNRNNALAALPLMILAVWLAPQASAAGHSFWGA